MTSELRKIKARLAKIGNWNRPILISVRSFAIFICFAINVREEKELSLVFRIYSFGKLCQLLKHIVQLFGEVVFLVVDIRETQSAHLGNPVHLVMLELVANVGLEAVVFSGVFFAQPIDVEEVAPTVMLLLDVLREAAWHPEEHLPVHRANLADVCHVCVSRGLTVSQLHEFVDNCDQEKVDEGNVDDDKNR